jgi:flavin-dependent dehydrogenase
MRDPFKLCAHGIFVAGDAAGIADPVSGAGIVSGMESGRIAGTCAGLHARGGGAGIDAEKRYANDMKKLHKDRSLRFAIRRVVSAMSDQDLSRLIGAVGEFAARGSLLKSDPFRLAKFLVRAMPRKFGIIKNLMRS